MTNFKRALSNLSRAGVLAALMLSVAPVLAGSYAKLHHHRVLQISSSGESVIYRSSDAAAINQNHHSTEPKSDLL